MIRRVVKLQFKTGFEKQAKELLEGMVPEVSSYPGCTYLEVLLDMHHKGRIFTYSHWNSEAHLNHYRHSETFRSFWRKLKPYLEKPAEAWSTQPVQFGS